MVATLGKNIWRSGITSWIGYKVSRHERLHSLDAVCPAILELISARRRWPLPRMAAYKNPRVVTAPLRILFEASEKRLDWKEVDKSQNQLSLFFRLERSLASDSWSFSRWTYRSQVARCSEGEHIVCHLLGYRSKNENNMDRRWSLPWSRTPMECYLGICFVALPSTLGH